MRAPSFLSHCLLPRERGSHSFSSILDKDGHYATPAVEILPSKVSLQSTYNGESVDVQGFHSFKGKISVGNIVGFSGPELISSKVDGSCKSWDSSIDLVNVLKHEIRDGQLSFRGKRVLELSCSYGLAGIFACLKGACTVHFHDTNAETIRCTTIPNVQANLEQACDWQNRQPEGPQTPSRQPLAPSVHFYAGNWEELPAVLSVAKTELTPRMSMCLSEDDLNDACSSQDGSTNGRDSSAKPRFSRKLSGSRAWERASEADHGEGGYDVVLITDVPFSVTSLKKLYSLIKKCLRPPYGVLYLATKKNFVGFNNGARHLRSIVDEEGIYGAHLVKEMTDREIWKIFLK
ncbi:hypothetical protein RND81_12G088100 [Saponaria officinalis]|uniref:S-adenosyl-L-methionine-dependent methyltransferase superfamily protein n=1 Tax=Saponaria officinalis TaxID=3572 RepID=A0AAW1H898_SAPOF